ncbi:MAG: OmpA family protein, partial [Acidimicrobiia bacterium]|nr:OmpA family protein [Acidimicrobiia bacterium]
TPVPESGARIVASLPESSVVVIDPNADSRSERVEELAESVGASLEGDTARIVVEESVLFEFGSAELLDSASDVLDDIAELLTELAAERIDIAGHTDSVGSEQYNLDLSTRRARAVEQALVERGVDGDVMDATGRGETEPVAPNGNQDGSDNPEGRARNRRVEVTATGLAG